MSVPDYQRVIDGIEDQIRSGTLKAGDALPSISKLSEIYNTSPSTVVNALRILRARGLIRGQQGKATYVV